MRRRCAAAAHAAGGRRWVRPSGEGREHAGELFDAIAAAPFLRSLDAAVSASKLQRALNLSRPQFELLQRDGYLQPMLGGSRHRPVWDLREARTFVDCLLRRAEPVTLSKDGWSDIATAAQRLKTRPGVIVRIIAEGRLQRLGRYTGREGYPAVLVQRDEVAAFLDRPEAAGISIEVFAKTVGIRRVKAMRLVNGGHVPSTAGLNVKTRATQRLLAPANVTAFHDRFVTIRTLAAMLDQTWQSLRPRLAEAGIAPFSPDGHDYGSLYEWSVVEKILISRLPNATTPSLIMAHHAASLDPLLHAHKILNINVLY